MDSVLTEFWWTKSFDEVFDVNKHGINRFYVLLC